MSLTHINNGDSGLVARTKINAGFDAIDALGAPGSSGTSGVSGSSGTSGVNGVAGANGSSGSSGTSGVNGSAGSSGTSGANGSSFIWLGAWSNLTVYSPNDVVEYNGSSYISLSPNSGSQPDTNPLDWSLMSQAGANGSSGTSGVSGTSGTSPAGGGGGGLVAGGGLYSIQSEDTLTPGASASGDYSIALGGSTASGAGAISIGTNNTDINGGSSKLNNILIGRNIYMTVGNSLAIVDNNILIGNAASLRPGGGAGSVDNNVVIGNGAYIEGAEANNGVAIGYNAKTGRFNSVAIGANSQTAFGVNIAVAIGSGSNATTETGVAIGYNVSQSGYSVNIGYDGSANGYKAIGLMGRANANYSFASSGGEITQVGGIAIGNGAYSSHANAACFGATVSSVAENTTHVNRFYIKNCPVYADNTAALAGGLVAGEVYRTSTGVLMITY